MFFYDQDILFVHTHAGKTEGMVAKLTSILAQFEFAYQVHEWESKGVPFATHLYVPEPPHPESLMPFVSAKMRFISLRYELIS